MYNYKNIILLNVFIIVIGIYTTPSYSKEKFMDNLKLYPKSI